MIEKMHRTLRVGKLALKDFLISIALFVMITCFAFPLVHGGTSGLYYVIGSNNQGAANDYGVRATEQTVSVSVSSGSAVYSFATLIQADNHDFFATGFMQGTDYYGQLHSSPSYYVDRVLNGVYQIWIIGQANAGENHQYSVFTDSTGQSMTASIDGTIQHTENGYKAEAKQANGETETHNTADVMNHHLWGMQYRPLENRYYNFANDLYRVDSPYHQNVISSTEWYATG
jgi:hypothetical protein